MYMQTSHLFFRYFSLMKRNLIQEGDDAMHLDNPIQRFPEIKYLIRTHYGLSSHVPRSYSQLFNVARKDQVAWEQSQRLSYIIYLFQCSNYSRGLITGSLCRPLCETKEIEFENCLGHGVKLHVLRARWKDSTVILKTPKQLGSSIAVRHAINSLLLGSQLEKEGFTMTRKTFIERVGIAVL